MSVKANPTNSARRTRASAPAGESQDPSVRDATLREDGLDGILGYRLAMAALATTAAFEGGVGQAFNLRPAEFTMLALIAANPGISARRLAQAIAVTPPFITVGVDKLAARGLIRRSRSATDKRSQMIEATDSGLALARTSAARACEEEGRLLQQLDADERVQLLALLRKLSGGR